MAESETFVVFDHHLLRVALSEEKSLESEALNTLIKQCPSRLLFDDSQGVLGRLYQELLRPNFQLIRTQLLSRVESEDKIVERRRRSPVERVPRRQIRDWKLFEAALAVRPTFIVTSVRQWLNHGRRFEQQYNLRILSAGEFTQLMERQP